MFWVKNFLYIASKFVLRIILTFLEREAKILFVILGVALLVWIPRGRTVLFYAYSESLKTHFPFKNKLRKSTKYYYNLSQPVYRRNSHLPGEMLRLMVWNQTHLFSLCRPGSFHRQTVPNPHLDLEKILLCFSPLWLACSPVLCSLRGLLCAGILVCCVPACLPSLARTAAAGKGALSPLL